VKIYKKPAGAPDAYYSLEEERSGNVVRPHKRLLSSEGAVIAAVTLRPERRWRSPPSPPSGSPHGTAVPHPSLGQQGSLCVVIGWPGRREP